MFRINVWISQYISLTCFYVPSTSNVAKDGEKICKKVGDTIHSFTILIERRVFFLGHSDAR